MVLLCGVLAWPSLLAAEDHVVLLRDGQRQHLLGKVLVQSQDGGLLVLARDGVLWGLQPEEIVRHDQDDQPPRFLDRAQLATQLLGELPAGFQPLTTANYLICYNTSRAYAEWTGSLFERLFRAYYNYWDQRGLKLDRPTLPLTAIVFHDQASFTAYAGSELGDAASSVIGYYSLRTNRILTFDLTGIERLRAAAARPTTVTRINQLLARTEAERTVATVIHEATHQLAFNSGLHTRYADIPMWLSEGIAIYFETPDLTSSRGWRGIGQVNQLRLGQFRAYLPRRPADSLVTLLADDQRFRRVATANEAYAESWALCYYLLQRYPREMLGYLQTMAAKQPLDYAPRDQRLREFQAAFAADLTRLDGDLVRATQRLSP